MRPIRIFLNEYTKTIYKYIYIYAPTPEYIDVTNKKINEAQTTRPNHSIELNPINRNSLKSFNLWPSYKVNHVKLGNF